MVWILFAFIGPVSWAASTHIDKYLVDKYFQDADTAVLMVFTAIVGIIALPPIWLVDPEVLALPPLTIAVMAASGLLYMGAMLFYLRAIQSAEVSAVAPLFQLSVIFTLALGWLLLHEHLTWVQLGGVALILAGALSLSIKPHAFLRSFNVRLLALMVGATLVMSLSTVAFKYFAIEDASYWGTTFWTFVGEALFGIVILVLPGRWKQFEDLFRRNPGAMLGVNAANEVINLGGGLAVRYASLLAPVALVSAVSSTTTLFVFLFGILLTLFLPKYGREDLSRRNLIRKGVAALLVAAGVALSGGSTH